MFMNFVISFLRKQFPDSPGIQTNELNDKIDNNENVLLVDCRRPDEYQISRIPNATNIHFKCSDDDLKTALAEVDPNVTIVNYCSLGYRSGVMTKRILDLDLDNVAKDKVYNLEGSIFKWAEEERPLLDFKEQPTKFVHPFSYKFAIPTLSRSKWKWQPEDQ